MKNIIELIDLWEIGNFSGTNRSHGRVTVEPDWYLNLSSTLTTSGSIGKGPVSKKLPFRYFHLADNSQEEVEIPNVASIEIDRSIDADADTCKITIYNTVMNDNDEEGTLPDQLGEPGYYTFDYGLSEEAQARWNRESNSWANVLVPNALIRTREGYGGYEDDNTPKSIADCVTEGALTLTGIWLIDTVNYGTDGRITINCRSTAKLLLDQILFPPLIPNNLYPLEECRWRYENYNAKFNPRKPITSGNVTDVYPQYLWSSVDAWYGDREFPFPLHGHRGSDTVDGNPETYAMSVGNYHPTSVFCCLGGDTKVPTLEYGLIDIKQLAGKHATIVSKNTRGITRWEKVPFYSYGVKEVYEIKLSRSGKEKSIIATENHGWYINNNELVSTKDLRTGDSLKTVKAPPAVQRGGCKLSKLGIAAGLVYGDGSKITRKSGRGYSSSRIQLYEDSQVFRGLFEDLGATASEYILKEKTCVLNNKLVHTNRQKYTDIQGLPGYFKDSPPMDESTSYLYGWLAGYFAADGSVNSHNGGMSITSTKKESIECVYNVCLRLGIVTGEIHHEIRHENNVWTIRFNRSSVPDEFFLLEKHRKIADKFPGHNYDIRNWKVISVCKLEEQQEVYCAKVPKNKNFMIEGNIITHNCDYWEWSVGNKINEFYLHPWAGNYTMYVSVMENGVWQTNGEGLIPYSVEPLIGTNYDEFGDPNWVDTGAAIPYITRTTVPWEEAAWYQLPRTFTADKIRITFRNHTLTDLGPWLYRCGIREFKIRQNTLHTDPPALPWVFSIIPYRQGDGYLCVADDGQVFPFGDARSHTRITDNSFDSTVVSMYPSPTGGGYWVLQNDGRLFAYGDATDFDNPEYITNTSYRPQIDGSLNYIDLACTPDGSGMWLIKRDGTLVCLGTATDYGTVTSTALLREPVDSYIATGIESHPTLDGYWIVNGNGHVEAFGDVPDYGGITPFRDRLKSNEWVRGIVRNEDGDGYWLLGGDGHVYNKGNTEFWGEIGNDPSLVFNDVNDVSFRNLTWQMAPTSTGLGYWLVKADGTVVPFGDAWNYGSPGGEGTLRFPGSYTDYSQIVKQIALWAGFWYAEEDPPGDEEPSVYGNIEETGIYNDYCLTPDQFDKKSPMEVIHMIRDIVGYLAYVDDEGAFRFEPSNVWSIGNYLNDGTPFDYMPEIDEMTNLFDYQVDFSAEMARSEIIIGTEDPVDGNFTTNTTKHQAATARFLRGMVNPAIWTNGLFANMDEQRIMAELIAMHIWFQMRQGSVTIPANPCIQVDDQVRIYERVTSESYVHYVRGIHSSHNLETGEYYFTLTTNWLGTEDDWVITSNSIPGSSNHGPVSGARIQITEWLLNRLANSTSKKMKNSWMNFETMQQNLEPAFKAIDGATDPEGSGGAADGV